MDNAFDITFNTTFDIAPTSLPTSPYDLTADITIFDFNTDIAFDTNIAFDIDIAFGITDIAFDIAFIRLTSLHVGKNSIPEKEMREIMAIAVHVDSMKILCEVPFKDKTLDVLDVSGKNLGMEGALVVAEYLDGNGSMTALDISANSIVANACIKAPRKGIKIGELVDGNPVIKEEDSNGEIKILHLNGIRAIARAVSDMGAISVKVYGLKKAQHLNGLTGRITDDLPNGRRVVQLENGEQKSLKPENLEVIGTGIGAVSTVIVNTFPLPIQDIKSKVVLDFSSKELELEDIIIIAALIPSNVSHKPYISLLLSLISLYVTRGHYRCYL
jgi:hypothetical protein